MRGDSAGRCDGRRVGGGALQDVRHCWGFQGRRARARNAHAEVCGSTRGHSNEAGCGRGRRRNQNFRRVATRLNWNLFHRRSCISQRVIRIAREQRVLHSHQREGKLNRSRISQTVQSSFRVAARLASTRRVSEMSWLLEAKSNRRLMQLLPSQISPQRSQLRSPHRISGANDRFETGRRMTELQRCKIERGKRTRFSFVLLRVL